MRVGRSRRTSPRRCSRRAPTSSSAATRTACSARARSGPSLVAYGLGNFVYFREDGESGRSGVLLATATGREVDDYSWVPARITNGVPVPEPGDDAAAADIADGNAGVPAAASRPP